MTSKPRAVLVKEVGLRDGLQIINTVMPTGQKLDWCARAVRAGLTQIEVTSLVPPKLIPQFFDAGAVIQHAKSLPGLEVSALIPNVKGFERGVALGADSLVHIISVSESFNLANVRRPRQASIDDLRTVMALRAALPEGERPRIIGGVSSAFGCTMEGRLPVRDVVATVETMLEAGVDELVLADTTGSGDPAWVSKVLPPVLACARGVPVAAHFHDTRGLGLANVLASLECGIRRFDASLGGLGGCPNSPGATGNIATEDLVYMLESMGFDTGIDLEALVELRRDLAGWLPDVAIYGHLARCGPATGFAEFRGGRHARPYAGAN
jgi:hydroxymethylglutaryl-CoA lyase